MTTYKGIKGFSIQTVAGDPSNNIAGQMWYNNSAKKIKVFKAGAGAWATGNDSNASHGAGMMAGTQTASITAGGYRPGSPNTGADSEEYNGTSWAEGNNIPANRTAFWGAGTQTAALTAGGSPGSGAVAETIEYDGTSWSATNDLGTGRYGAGTGGIQTAGLQVGGYSGSTKSEVEEYNGSTWTEVTNTPAA